LYFNATDEVRKDGGRATLSALSNDQRAWLNAVVEKRESQKAVLTVLIALLLKKIEHPAQDIRLHKEEFPQGFSGRTYDTKYVTPFMKDRFRRLAMAESGWLTRSLEQPHPLTKDFPGKIRDKRIKDALLRILDDVEEHGAAPDKYLTSLFVLLIQYTADASYLHNVVVGAREATIDRIINGL
jgi:DNA (cytosine-5)-methyltransferase 1